MTPPAIAVSNLTVAFGDYCALDDLSFTVPPGAFVAIVGPNGAGKSTLIKVLLGLIAPRSGSVRLLGSEGQDVPVDRLGYVPQIKQMDRTFPARAIELVATGWQRSWPWRLRGERREAAMAALKQVGASHLAERPLSGLSGGELQRVYLARSLAREPRLVLLDEPATGIDEAGKADICRLLEAYQRNRAATLMMVTHDWQIAHHHASHVLLINRRLIAFDAPAAALSESHLSTAFGHIGHHHHHTHSGPHPAHD